MFPLERRPPLLLLAWDKLALPGDEHAPSESACSTDNESLASDPSSWLQLFSAAASKKSTALLSILALIWHCVARCVRRTLGSNDSYGCASVPLSQKRSAELWAVEHLYESGTSLKAAPRPESKAMSVIVDRLTLPPGAAGRATPAAVPPGRGLSLDCVAPVLLLRQLL